MDQDTAGREVSVRVSDTALVQDTAGREVSVKVADASNIIDAAGREVSVRVKDAESIFDSAGREVTVQVKAADWLIDVAGREVSVYRPLPDLTIPSFSAPSEMATDQTFTIAWFDENSGEGPATGGFYDHIYLSQDATLSGNDRLLGQFQYTADLAPGELVLRIQDVLVPRNAVQQEGDYYLIFATDFYDQQEEGTKEGNNVAVAPIRVLYEPFPNLVVQQIEAPAQAIFGTTIQVRALIKNIDVGPTNSSGWADSFAIWREADGDRVRVSVANPAHLEPGQSYWTTANLKIPINTLGNWHLVVHPDASGNVNETNESDNRTLKAIEIIAPPLPDLNPDYLQGPSFGAGGQTIPVEWMVTNTGTADTPPHEQNWSDRIVLSSDEILSGNDRTLLTVPRTGGLLKDASYIEEHDVFIPYNTPGGTYYLLLVCDTNNQVNEVAGEVNNVISDPMPIEIFAAVADLQIAVDPSTPTVADSGDTVTIKWKVTNNGPDLAKAPWMDKVYFSEDATLDASDIALAAVSRAADLTREANYQVSTSIMIPRCKSGTYHLFFKTDTEGAVYEATFEDNNSAAHGLNVNPNVPDLTVASVSHPLTVSAGQPMRIEWLVRNSGDGKTRTAAWVDSIHLSRDSVLDSLDLLLQDVPRSGELQPGATYRRDESVVVPQLSAGSYYIIVTANRGRQVDECGLELNNSTAGPSIVVEANRPDLQITSITAPGTVNLGQIVDVAWTGENRGAVDVIAESWSDALYLSTDTTLDALDRELGRSYRRGPLAVNASYQSQAQFNLKGIAPGPYFLIVSGDHPNTLFEGLGEGNNTLARPIEVRIAEANLRITGLTAPATAYSGERIAVSFTVTNVGTEPTVELRWNDVLLLSRDGNVDPTDYRLLHGENSEVLLPGQSRTHAGSAYLPQGLTGKWHLIGYADLTGYVTETDELDNDSAAHEIQLQLPPPLDLIPTSVTIPASGNPGEPVSLSFTVLNDGPNEARGEWVDSVYLSSDQTWDPLDEFVGRVTKLGPVPSGQSYTGNLEVDLPAALPGQYYVIVRANARNQVREDDRTNNDIASSNRMAVDFIQLPLGVPYTTTLRQGKDKFFKTATSADETVRFSVDVTNTGTTAATEMFVRSNEIVRRSNYDFRTSQLWLADQSLIVPRTVAGIVFTLLGIPVAPVDEPAVVLAEVLPLSVEAVRPKAISDSGQVTITLSGGRLWTVSAISLIGPGGTYRATWKELKPNGELRARFFLDEAVRGKYDVVVDADGQLAVLDDGITIEEPKSGEGQLAMLPTVDPWRGNSVVRPIAVTNTSNFDLPYVTILCRANQEGLIIYNDRPEDTLPRKGDFPEADWRRKSPTVQNLDGQTLDYFVLRDLAPGDVATATFFFDPSTIRTFPLRVTVQDVAHTAIDAEARYRIRFESLRLGLLHSDIEVPPELQGVLSSPEVFWETGRSQLQALGLLQPQNRRGDNGQIPLTRVSNHKDECGVRFLACNLRAWLEFGFCVLGTKGFGPPACWAWLAAAKAICAWEFNMCVKYGDKPPCAPNCSFEEAVYRARGALAFEPFADPFDGELFSFDLGDLFGDGVYWSAFAGLVFIQTETTYRLPLRLDPNDKLGPTGFSDAKFVTPKSLPYTIRCENLATATGWAVRIEIADDLDPSLDLRTLRLQRLRVGDSMIDLTSGGSSYFKRVPLKIREFDLLADVAIAIDPVNRKLRAVFEAIDPQTGEPPVAIFGLLPPEDGTGIGQAELSYVVDAYDNVATGTIISNAATIVFDGDAPLTTNAVTNTLDSDLPVSQIDANPIVDRNVISLTWTGSDPAGGSGLAHFDIFVSENGGHYRSWLNNTTLTSARFNGKPNATYRFYSVARDNAGNVEDAPPNPDAEAATEKTGPDPILAKLIGFEPTSVRAGSSSFTLRVKGVNFESDAVVYWNGEARPTVWKSSRELEVDVSSTLIESVGEASLYVLNPAKNGLEDRRSNVRRFAITP
ncbi:MAG: hypothetical protein HONBIEJF_00344 [Fimbriimonadaceae bacterium]|nr:hypothetical protein [Fimbriimonadaceae bacterium]